MMIASGEKDYILMTAAPTQAPARWRRQTRRSKWTAVGSAALLAGIFALASLYAYLLYGNSLSESAMILLGHNRSGGGGGGSGGRTGAKLKQLCHQSDVLYPESTSHVQLWDSLGRDFDDDAFMTRAVAWLAGAVRIPTESYDNNGPVGEDERWETFGLFHDYLEQAFPLTHKSLTLTKVNTYGLLYEWKGSDASLKPLLLTGHQDVVPVDPETVDKWEHPPYSGYYDGKFIWGRGSSDDKSGVIGILASIETLLEKQFKPARTVVLAFGFDGETTSLGAQHLSDAMMEKYGQDSFALLVDECPGSVYRDIGDTIIAIPGISEKGLVDTRVKVSTLGGHSSVPPAHTSIGILSRLLVEYEANPIKPHLERDTPIYNNIQCVGQYAKNIPAHLRALIKTSVHSDKALRKLEAELITDPFYSALIGTTQAIDLVQGGVKSNALPEEAWAVINHRIATQSSVAAVQQRDTDILKQLAREFNLTFTAFGSEISTEDGRTAGRLTLTEAWPGGTPLEPAPITPFGEDSAPWQLLSGTIKATFNAHRGLEGADNIFVSPGITTGNTDTRYYWNLTRHIIRYNHHDGGKGFRTPNNIHNVNEYMPADNFVEMIRFLTTLILNADESRKI